jgi:hypothetical protein
MAKKKRKADNRKRQQPQYPIGTVAMYGPDDRTTTKIAAGVILHDGAEPIMKRWVATDVTTNPTARPFRSAWQTAVVGGLAATAAFVIAKAIG